MPRKTFEDYVIEYSALAKKKRVILKKMTKLLKGKRVTLPDTARNSHIPKKHRTLYSKSKYFLFGDTDEGRLSFYTPNRHWRSWNEVIIDDDPLLELLK